MDLAATSLQGLGTETPQMEELLENLENNFTTFTRVFLSLTENVKTFKHDHDVNLILLHLVENENLNQCDWMKWNRDLRILENWNQTLEMENSSSSEAFNLNISSMCPLSLSFKVGNQGSKVLRYQGRKLTKDLICDFSSTFENRLPKILFLLCGFENITSEHYERKKESIA